MAEPARKRVLIEEVMNNLQELPEERLEEVRDFVQALRRRGGASREGILAFFGTWEGPPGELAKLVEEIYEARDSEEEEEE